jgi:hypothetical protein
VKQIEKVDLDIPHFNCDSQIVKKGLPEPYEHMNRSNSTFFLGPPGSGKTSLMISLISQKSPKLFRKAYNHIILVMPSHSRASLKKDVFQGISNYYEDLTNVTIDQIYDAVTEYADEGHKTLLIMDDITAAFKSSKYIQDRMAKMLFNRRHLGLSCWIMLQSYKSVPLNIRKVLDCCFVFKISKSEQECLYQENFEYTKDITQKIMSYVYKDTYAWCFLHIPSQSIYTNEYKQIEVVEPGSQSNLEENS